MGEFWHEAVCSINDPRLRYVLCDDAVVDYLLSCLRNGLLIRVPNGDIAGFASFEYVAGIHTEGANTLSAPNERFAGMRCVFCGGFPAWVHDIKGGAAKYLVGEDEYRLASRWLLCMRCEDLYGRGEDDRLIGIWKSFVNDVDEWSEGMLRDELELPLSVFRCADLGGRRLP